MNRPIAFLQDDRGTILVFWAMSLAVLFGIVALSFDIGRMATTKSELQAYADHVALAAAGELDGKGDSITRATAAAANLIADSQTFGGGSRTLSGAADYSLSFYRSLPASDQAAMTGATTDPYVASYVRVVATPRRVGLTFGRVLYGLRGQTAPVTTVGATAIAGFTQYACDITPLMFCLPSPTYSANANIGKMINLRSGKQGAAWGPGDFGFLDPDKLAVDPKGPCGGLNGAQLDACLIGAEGSVTACFSQRGVDTEPGQKVGIEDAIFNTRFDIYKSIMNGKKNDPKFAPAPNVIKGLVPKGGNQGNGPQCIAQNEQASPDTLGLPRDGCLVAGTCGRFGDGDWSAGRAAYVAANYGGSDPNPGALTRYAYYLAEIAASGGAASSQPILTGKAETGRPMCSPNRSINPERRLVIAAGIDCSANPISGRTNNVPVAEFFRLFLTEPVGDDDLTPPTLDIWAEVVGSAGGNGGSGGTEGVVHDVVQLYR